MMYNLRTLDDYEETMTDEHRTRLLYIRGGCTCFISPPCGACTNPLTYEEAELLGLIDMPMDDSSAPKIPPEVWKKAPHRPVDYMRHVRDMCKGG